MATVAMRAAILDGAGLPLPDCLDRAPAAAARPGSRSNQGQRRQSPRPQDPGRRGRARPPALAGNSGHRSRQGTVEAVGPDVIAFHDGDDVYGMAGGVGGLQGSLAEFSAVDARLLARKPANLTMREAAALPLAFITAWEGGFGRSRRAPRPERRCWFTAGAGGVGHIAIQIARAFDAKTFATGSAESMAYIAGLGATPINYREEAVEAYVGEHTDGEGFDIVYDTVGGKTLNSSFKAVRRFWSRRQRARLGRAFARAPFRSPRRVLFRRLYLAPDADRRGSRASQQEILGKATQLIEAEKVKPRVDPRRFSLSTLEDAYSALKDGGSTGKIVVDADESTTTKVPLFFRSRTCRAPTSRAGFALRPSSRLGQNGLIGPAQHGTRGVQLTRLVGEVAVGGDEAAHDGPSPRPGSCLSQ